MTMEPVQYVDGSYSDLTLNIVLDEDGFEFEDNIYEDDGLSFEYQQDNYNLIEYKVSAEGNGLRLEFNNKKTGFESELDNLQIRILNLDSESVEITFNGEDIRDEDYFYQGDDLLISLPYQEEGAMLINSL